MFTSVVFELFLILHPFLYPHLLLCELASLPTKSRFYFPVPLTLGLAMWFSFFLSFFDHWNVGGSFQHMPPEESLMRVSNLCHGNMPPVSSCWSGSQNEHMWSISEPSLNKSECVNKCSLCAIGFLAGLLQSNRWQIQHNPSICSGNPHFPGYAQ